MMPEICRDFIEAHRQKMSVDKDLLPVFRLHLTSLARCGIISPHDILACLRLAPAADKSPADWREYAFAGDAGPAAMDAFSRQ